MSFVRSLPVLLSIFISAVFLALGIVSTPAKGDSYAALVCGADVPDREIRERLEAQGFTGIVSESGQWVLLDSFGSIERISLDQYHVRIFPFDPRNDGYAEKLRSLFVREERRFIYIPLDSLAEVPLAKIEKRLATALEGIPHSFHAAAGRPTGLFLVLFCLAAGIFLVIRPVRLSVRPHAACLIPLLPALVPFALGGAAGFAMASLLSGCTALLAGPCLERFTLPRQRGEPPLVCWLLPPLLVICCCFLGFLSGLPPVFTLPLLAFFCGLLIFSLRRAYISAAANNSGVWGMFQRRVPGRRRFSPVPILSRRSPPFAFAWAMLPFAAAALVLACVGIAGSVTRPTAFSLLPPAGAVTEADYYAHYRFQTSFSFRSLYETVSLYERPGHDGVAVYEIAPDGLLLQHDPVEAEFSPESIPSFPLGDLLLFLDTPQQGGADTLLPVLLPLCFIIPALVYGRNAGRREKEYLLTTSSFREG